jgi:hypothetical protein
MPTSISELIAALPAESEAGDPPAALELPAPLSSFSLQPVPIGRFRRAATLGTLQAKIGAA